MKALRFVAGFWPFPLIAAFAVFLAVCTPSEQQAADRTVHDVCAIIAPNTDGGFALFDKLVHDVAELEALERARLDAAAALARDAGGP